MKPTAQIFLCYAHQDAAEVAALYQKLKDAGYKPWMDKFDLIGGELWQPTIEKAIQKSDFFIACLSKNSVNRRGFLRREINVALETLKELLESDIYIIPVRLEECEVPENLSLFQWVNLFDREGWDRLLKAVHKGIDRLGVIKQVTLRSQPILELSDHDVTKMLKEKGFPDLYRNRFGRGLQHQYELIKSHAEKLAIDHTTGLTWQQSGSRWNISYANAETYIGNLNRNGVADCADWRMPTLEEAMSLLEFEANGDDLCIDPLFDRKQTWIWTADKRSVSLVWSVSFRPGDCNSIPFDTSAYVRAVRSE